MRTCFWAVALAALASCGGRVAPGSGSDGGAGDAGDGGDAGDAGGPPAAVPCSFSDACEGTAVCDRLLKHCVECRTSADCAAGKVCEASVCKAALGCQSDLQCTSKGLVCDAAGARCVQCNSAADCRDATPCLGHSCVAYPKCTSSLDCAANSLVCSSAPPPQWPATFAGQGCQECAAASDCPQGSSCHGGLCYEACLLAAAKCGTVDGVACGACPAGQCSALRQGCLIDIAWVGQDEFNGFVLGTTYAYASFRGSNNNGRVYRVTLSNGQSTAIATPSTLVEDLAANATYVFWNESHVLKKYPKAGGSAAEVGRIGTGDGFIREVEADDTQVYVAFDYDSTIATGIYKTAVGGSTFTPIMTGSQVSNMVLTGDRLYWNDYQGDVSYTKTGGGTRAVSTGNKQVFGRMVVDATHLYFGGDDALYRVPRDGGTPQAFIDSSAQPIAIIDGVLYFSGTGAASGSSGFILGKVALPDGTPEPVLAGEDLAGTPTYVGFVGHALYFVEWGQYSVRLRRYDPL